jgi:hypothetical protein
MRLNLMAGSGGMPGDETQESEKLESSAGGQKSVVS